MALDAPRGALGHLDLEQRGEQMGCRPAIAIGGVGETLPVAVDAGQAQRRQEGREHGGGLIGGPGHQIISTLSRLLYPWKSGGGIVTSSCALAVGRNSRLSAVTSGSPPASSAASIRSARASTQSPRAANEQRDGIAAGLPGP
jgi:hypothetical protein